MTIAVYPGSFDPFTKGHMDIVERGAGIFDEIVVGVLMNSSKQPFFELDERVSLIQEACKGIKNVRVEKFSGLLVNYMDQIGASIILKGLRAVADYEYELSMAQMNKCLNSKVETMFLMSNSNFSHVSSSMIKDIVSLGGDVSDFLPENINKILINRINGRI